jgi:hypothetical protein
MLHVQPVPLAAVGVRPVGRASLTVTVVPSVAASPLSVKVPVLPRISVDALEVFDKVSDGVPGAAVATVTDPDAEDPSPPPMTEAVLVREAAASAATDAVMLMAG